MLRDTFHGLLTKVTTGPRILIMNIEFFSGPCGGSSSTTSPCFMRSTLWLFYTNVETGARTVEILYLASLAQDAPEDKRVC